MSELWVEPDAMAEIVGVLRGGLTGHESTFIEVPETGNQLGEVLFAAAAQVGALRRRVAEEGEVIAHTVLTRTLEVVARDFNAAVSAEGGDPDAEWNGTDDEWRRAAAARLWDG